MYVNSFIYDRSTALHFYDSYCFLSAMLVIVIYRSLLEASREASKISRYMSITFSILFLHNFCMQVCDIFLISSCKGQAWDKMLTLDHSYTEVNDLSMLWLLSVSIPILPSHMSLSLWFSILLPFRLPYLCGEQFMANCSFTVIVGASVYYRRKLTLNS